MAGWGWSGQRPEPAGPAAPSTGRREGKSWQPSGFVLSGPRMVCPWDSTGQGSPVFIFVAFTWGQQRLWTSFPGFDPTVNPYFWVLAENCAHDAISARLCSGDAHRAGSPPRPLGRGHFQLQAAPHSGQMVLALTHASSAHPGSLCMASPLRPSDNRASTFCRSHHRHTRYGLRRHIVSL